jgi:hypothetical protein
MAFHVFVEGATDATPAGVARLADAIAKHYGLAAPDLLARLQKGRFRVKGNTDRATAEQYCRDLQLLGARCVIEEATADNSQRSTPLPFPAQRPATPVAGTPVQPRPAQPQPSRPAQPAQPPRPAQPSQPSQYQSGLSAAFSGGAPAANLGALEQDSLQFSLSSVDGADDQPPADPAVFAPPASALSASIGPPPEKKAKASSDKPAKQDKPKDVPLDLFAPPDAQGDELAVDIAADEIEQSARKRASTPPATEPARGTSQQLPKRASQPSIQPSAAAVTTASKLGPLADPRARFTAGIVLALAIGFLPAHFIAAMREDSAYKEIDTKVMAAQQLADTPETYATLDRMRADQLDRKKGEQRNIAIIAFAIWVAVASAVAFAWFKKIPWDRYSRPGSG